MDKVSKGRLKTLVYLNTYLLAIIIRHSKICYFSTSQIELIPLFYLLILEVHLSLKEQRKESMKNSCVKWKEYCKVST